jgi:hypothetical protein
MTMTTLQEIEQAVQRLSPEDLAGFRAWFDAFAGNGCVKQPTTTHQETVEQSFRRLATEWKKATRHVSSTTVMNNHPAYRKIIGLGQEVVPLLLRDMHDNHTHWFCALREITGAQPIPQSAAGIVPKMVEAWLGWAKEHGCQW